MKQSDGDLKRFAEALTKLRLEKKKTVYYVRDCMEWKNETPYLRYETAVHLPKYETLERILVCLQTTFAERLLLLGLAGYLPSAPKPSLEQIQREFTALIPEIYKYPYPVFVVDPGFVFWFANPTAKLFLGNMDANELGRRRATAFDLAFDARLGLTSRISNIMLLRRELVRRFKGVSVYRQHKAFYQAFPTCMQNRLTGEDYEVFEQVWNTTGLEHQQDSTSVELGNRSLELSNNDRIEFDYVTERVSFSGDFLEIVRYIPKPNVQNIKLVEEIFGQFETTPDDCFKLWEVTDVEKLMSEYD